jgi:NAD(P)-dependent dehydrogenase (short-subunit alcohol dehydrogenase family)
MLDNLGNDGLSEAPLTLGSIGLHSWTETTKNKMAKILVTGSSGGLGLMTGRLLAEEGHRVVLHARSEARAEAVRAALPQAEAVVVGDLSTLAAMRDVADQANGQGRFDAVIHNVALGYREARRVETVDGLSQIWAVNVLAPYVLTALIHRPDRLVYLSSGMHTGGDSSLDDLQWSRRRWNGSQAYADTKFHDVLLAFGVARHWPDVLSNALTPGWVPTRMGGPGAPDDLEQGHLTQAWLAVSEDPEARVTGCYFYHQRLGAVNPAARDSELQDRLLDYCRDLSGIALA